MDRLNEIRHYIVTEYPDCCLASNYGDTPFNEYEKDLLVEELDDYFWLEHLYLCGCGSPDDCKEMIKKYLSAMKEYTDSDTENCVEVKHKRLKEGFDVEYVYENPLLLFLSYVLDSHGFTEHGGSIGGAWITGLGRMYLDVLNEIDFSE
jgi:hypothetical protein